MKMDWFRDIELEFDDTQDRCADRVFHGRESMVSSVMDEFWDPLEELTGESSRFVNFMRQHEMD